MDALTTHPFSDDDKLREECGVFGVFGQQDAAALTALGLHALQHRGQEAGGIVSLDGSVFYSERHVGLIGDTFTQRHIIDALPGSRAIGHVRYSTHGGSVERNIQPLFAEFAGGGFAVAHNGNLTNALTLQDRLQRRGSIFQSTSDTEVILHLIATSRQDRLVDRLIDALSQIEGAYSLVCLSSKKMIGCRDPLGVRPLVLGDRDGAPILASETCALDIIGARFVRDIEPGEMVVITEDGIESLRPFQPARSRFCIFEYVYFARPDSSVEGRGVYEARKKIGAELAREAPAPADVVVPVPDSGTPAAIGYADAAGIPFELGIIRNHYIGRTFIEPTDAIRNMGVRLKHNANRKIIEGKRVVLIDDSIVRGTTSLKIVQMVRDAGAREVHVRIASPPTKDSCFYGVDTPEKSKLIASHMSVQQMAEFIKADSLAFISIDGLYRAVGEAARDNGAPQFCDACFTGAYPTRLTDFERRDKVRALPARRSRLMSVDLSGRVAVVTGASRGIGRAAALGLATAGAHIVATARTVGGLEELDDEIRAAGGAATLVPLDLKDHAAIDRLGAALYERWGRLDILLGNAGLLGTITPVPHMEPRAFDEVMAINVTANYRLVRSLDPLLRQSDAGRVLFVTSGITQSLRPFWGMYAASKAALEALAVTYANEMRHTKVRVNLINPGALRTRMRAQAMPGEDPSTVKAPEVLVADILRLLAPAHDQTATLFDFPTGSTQALGG